MESTVLILDNDNLGPPMPKIGIKVQMAAIFFAQTRFYICHYIHRQSCLAKQ